MPDLDSIDKGILMILNKNSRSTGVQISKALSKMRISLTDRAVLQRIARLEEKRIIQAYTITLNPSIITEKSSNVVLLKFCPSADSVLIEKLDTYLLNSSFCLLAARIDGAEFDYICLLVFDTQKQFDLMLSVILTAFQGLISGYEIHQSKIIKQIPYRFSFDSCPKKRNLMALKISLALNQNGNTREKLRQFTDDIRKCFEAKCVCLWLVDKKTDELVMANAYGNYEFIPPEYAEISYSSINIGSILLTKKPVLANDLVNDFKGINVDWLTEENVRSYAGYPLLGKDRSMGVLEIFNDKAFSPRDFELAQLLSAELSGEISKLY